MSSEPVSSGLLLPDRSRELGLSMPMNAVFPEFSGVAVHNHRAGIKFAHVTSPTNRWLVIIFMDNVYTDHEMAEWQTFSDCLDDFRGVGASVLGVATDSHFAIRAWLTILKRSINFPIMADRDWQLSRSMGVCSLQDRQGTTRLQTARAVAVLSPDRRLVHLTVNNETTFSDPLTYIQLIKNLNARELERDDIAKVFAEKNKNQEQGKQQPWTKRVRKGFQDGASSVVSFLSKGSTTSKKSQEQILRPKSIKTPANIDNKAENPAKSTTVKQEDDVIPADTQTSLQINEEVIKPDRPVIKKDGGIESNKSEPEVKLKEDVSPLQIANVGSSAQKDNSKAPGSLENKVVSPISPSKDVPESSNRLKNNEKNDSVNSNNQEQKTKSNIALVDSKSREMANNKGLPIVEKSDTNKEATVLPTSDGQNTVAAAKPNDSSEKRDSNKNVQSQSSKPPFKDERIVEDVAGNADIKKEENNIGNVNIESHGNNSNRNLTPATEVKETADTSELSPGKKEAPVHVEEEMGKDPLASEETSLKEETDNGAVVFQPTGMTNNTDPPSTKTETPPKKMDVPPVDSRETKDAVSDDHEGKGKPVNVKPLDKNTNQTAAAVVHEHTKQSDIKKERESEKLEIAPVESSIIAPSLINDGEEKEKSTNNDTVKSSEVNTKAAVVTTKPNDSENNIKQPVVKKEPLSEKLKDQAKDTSASLNSEDDREKGEKDKTDSENPAELSTDNTPVIAEPNESKISSKQPDDQKESLAQTPTAESKESPNNVSAISEYNKQKEKKSAIIPDGKLLDKSSDNAENATVVAEPKEIENNSKQPDVQKETDFEKNVASLKNNQKEVKGEDEKNGENSLNLKSDMGTDKKASSDDAPDSSPNSNLDNESVDEDENSDASELRRADLTSTPIGPESQTKTEETPPLESSVETIADPKTNESTGQSNKMLAKNGEGIVNEAKNIGKEDQGKVTPEINSDPVEQVEKVEKVEKATTANSEEDVVAAAAVDSFTSPVAEHKGNPEDPLSSKEITDEDKVLDPSNDKDKEKVTRKIIGSPETEDTEENEEGDEGEQGKQGADGEKDEEYKKGEIAGPGNTDHDQQTGENVDEENKDDKTLICLNLNCFS